MGRIQQLISEISELRNEINHRSALRIYSLLDNNKKLFLEKLEPDNFKYLVKGFEDLSKISTAEYNTPGFKRDYNRIFESLMFHLNRIV
jgi:hypothetical protein